MPRTLTLHDARWLDVENGTWSTSDITTEDGRITEIAPAGTKAQSTETTVGEHVGLDLAGSFVLPGLIDCHVHVNAITADLRALTHHAASYVAVSASRLMSDMLDRGFTTVRDTGGADFGLADAQSEGILRGPRLFFGGKSLSQTGGHGDTRSRGEHSMEDPLCCASLGVLADGVDEVRRAARDQMRTGADHLKIMAGGGVASPTDRIDSVQYTEDEIRAAVEVARDVNRYVAAHAYTPKAITRSVRAGVRSIEHANLLDEASAAEIAGHDAFVTMNLVTYWALKEFGPENGLAAESYAKVDSVLGAGIHALKLAHERGLNLCFGTDLLGGMQVHQAREFAIRGEHLPALDIIRSATSTAARLLQREGELGEIRVGARADFAALPSDPLEDLSPLSESRLDLVVQDGSVQLDRRHR